MKTGTLTATALILTLLVQTTAALVPMPCVSAGSAEASSAEHPGHAHHAGHAASRQVTIDTLQPGESGDCCEGMSLVACAAVGCAAGGGTLLMAPVTSLQPVALNRFLDRAPDWLPPYGAPAVSIFRPPIA